MVEMFVGLVSLAVIIGCSLDIGYTKGVMDGRKKTIERLFYGEKDFRNYLEYRRQQMGGGEDDR